MISVREALDLTLRDARPVGTENVGLPEAGGRVLAESVRAARDIPPFRNAAMDGYAVRAADVTTATPHQPVVLRVLEVVAAGTVPSQAITPGTAAKIMTGSPMSDGADAVVRVEDTTEAGDRVRVGAPVAPGTNVRHPGEDLRAGTTVFEPGRILRPADIGLLASLGVAVVRVWRRPVVAILATGDELVELGQSLGPGQIVNSNGYTLAAAVAEAGGVPRLLGIVRDTAAATATAFGDALTADLVLSTGGVSVGSFDFVREALTQLGISERFWKVAQRPGKPMTFGVCQGTPVFGLPGNPVSSLVCFYVYVRAVLRHMQGRSDLHLPVVMATVAEDVETAAGLTEFVRCTLAGEPGHYQVRPTGAQGSHMLRSLSLGDALLIAPPTQGTIRRGTMARVMLLTGGVSTPPV